MLQYFEGVVHLPRDKKISPQNNGRKTFHFISMQIQQGKNIHKPLYPNSFFIHKRKIPSTIIQNSDLI